MRNVLWLGALAIALVIALAVQAASVALFGSLGRVPSFARVAAGAWPFAAAQATGADRLPAVRVELARAALLRDEPGRAAALLAGLPPGATVEDLRGRIALADGRNAEAVAAFGAAGDIDRAEAAIDAVGERDPRAAYALAAAFEADVARRNGPAPVRAEAAWRAGRRAALLAVPGTPDAARYNALALDLYRAAVRDDPTQEAYLLADGFAALATGDAAASRDAYRRAVAVAADGVDAYVGLALAEARLGDCRAARETFARAETFASRRHRAIDPAAAGYDADTRLAIRRCLAPA